MRYPKRKAYDIPTIHESLARKIKSGEMTLEDAALELHVAGWTNFVDLEYARESILGNSAV